MTSSAIASSSSRTWCTAPSCSASPVYIALSTALMFLSFFSTLSMPPLLATSAFRLAASSCGW
jgi:hypothetical protein